MKTKSMQPTIQDQIALIEPLCQALRRTQDLSKKLAIVSANKAAQGFLDSSPSLQTLLRQCDEASQFVIHAVLALGQGPVIFQDIDRVDDLENQLQAFVGILLKLEKFYQNLGGIVGYHLTMLKLMADKLDKSSVSCESIEYDEPEGLDCFRDTTEVRQAVRWGIKHMPQLAEIYPIGGAGERLDLHDENTGDPLPAAQLLFCGRTLLEGLIRDLQGREYLHYKLFGRQLTTPLAAMTSEEKDNHRRILNLCSEAEWFGRPRESFVFFMQQMVPMLTVEGTWAMQAPLQPFLRPGGHGVIWKAAADNGVFDWLKKFKRSKALVRQINNPIAGLDNGLFILAGIGCHQNKSFGFASCNRLLSAAEGMDVLCEKKSADGYDYCITNVEYTEFEKSGIEDAPHKPGSPWSRFPANTNILFVDLEAIKQAIAQCPIPGLLINMKSHVRCYAGLHKTIEKQAGRLESTMQNIADCIVDHFPARLPKSKRTNLRTFITFNERHKTISVAKQSYEKGKPILGTPEECFYDLMKNYHDLLANYCNFQLPQLNEREDYLANGPSFTVLFHPALGGLYSVIGQKIRGGRLAKGAEWRMEIAEAHIVNLDLQGSLLIEADAIMGQKDDRGILAYDSDKVGKCTLINVCVKNEGLEPSTAHEAWRQHVARKAALRITLHGNAEFFAENVKFEGGMQFDVPDGYRCVVSQQGSKITSRSQKIDKATWKWNYAFDDEHRIRLEPFPL